MTKYGRSPWIERTPKSRVPSYPRHRGHLNVDVAIVGGGLTGCATAYAFAVSGIKVAVVEATQVGRGVSGYSVGWIADDPGPDFHEVSQLISVRAARHAWQAWRRAALDFSALVRRLKLKCDIEPRMSLLVAMTPDQMTRLKREQKARREAGLDRSLISARAVAADTAIAAAGASKGEGATLDPYRAAIALAAAAADRGARIFERSPAKKITFGSKAVDIVTAGGTVRADRVVVATGMPTSLFKSLERHFWFRSSFLALTGRVPAKLRQQLGGRKAVVRDYGVPPHVIRWVDDERLLVTGADAGTVPPRLQEKTVVQRTGQLMYELSTIYPDISGILPDYGWAAPYARTSDGLPYIGPHRNYPRHLFAFGDASHSLTGAYLASRILLRHYTEGGDPADEAFGFNR